MDAHHALFKIPYVAQYVNRSCNRDDKEIRLRLIRRKCIMNDEYIFDVCSMQTKEHWNLDV